MDIAACLLLLTCVRYPFCICRAILRAALRQAGAIKAEDEAAMLAEPAVPA